MKIERTKLPGVLIFTQDAYHDERGYFKETCNSFMNFTPVQANQSVSSKGVIRGLHYQPGLAKLIWVAQGSIHDIVYNLSTGDWQGFELTADNHKQLLCPEGYAHGFQALEDDTIVCYLMDDYYNPHTDRGLNTSIVKWPLKKQIISQKDRNAPELRS